MGTPRPLHGLLLVDAIDDAHIGSAFDKARHADRDLGPAILAAHQQMRPVVGRCQRRRDQRAVVERGFLVGDDPRRIAARSALARPLARVRGGSIEAVVAFEPLAIVLDLTAGIGRVLRLRPGGEDHKRASDDQGGAHTPMRADRVSPCKAGASLPVPKRACPSSAFQAGRSRINPTSAGERAQHTTSGLAATIETDWHDCALLVRYERKLREALKTRCGTSCRRSIAKPRFPGPRTLPARSPSMPRG